MLTTLERMPRLFAERWEPFRDLEREFERLLEPIREGMWSPHFDLVETDGAYEVTIELPGMRREDIALEFVGNELVCHGEVKEQEREGVLRRQTRRTGAFRFELDLGHRVDADAIEATLADGVLKVHAPKLAPTAHRPIEVKAAS